MNNGEPSVSLELVRQVAQAREAHTAITGLKNGMAVGDVPLPRYDGVVVAERDTIRRLLLENGDDAEFVAKELTEAARDLWRRSYYR